MKNNDQKPEFLFENVNYKILLIEFCNLHFQIEIPVFDRCFSYVLDLQI